MAAHLVKSQIQAIEIRVLQLTTCVNPQRNSKMGKLQLQLESKYCTVWRQCRCRVLTCYKDVVNRQTIHKLMNWQPSFNRLPGHPRNCWMENIKVLVETRASTVLDVEHANKYLERSYLTRCREINFS